MSTFRDVVTRGRFLGSVNARYSPVSWLNLDGNVSFDRADVGREQYQPKGVRNMNGVPGVGSIWYTSNRIEGTNASASAQIRRTLGDLNTTTTVRYLVEQEDNQYHEVSSSQFMAEGVYTIGNTPSTQRTGASSKNPGAATASSSAACWTSVTATCWMPWSGRTARRASAPTRGVAGTTAYPASTA
jgi:hypothetical protein